MIDFHTHNNKTAEGIFAIRSFSIAQPPTPIPTQPFSIGLHPWHTDNPPTNWIQTLCSLASAPQCLMIGECGLDKLKGADLQQQIALFRQQADLSETLGKPLVVHCVKAFNELLSIRDELHPTQPWTIHGFRGSLPLADQLIRHGFYLSIGAPLLFQGKLSDTLRQLPLDRIFFETDDSSERIESLYLNAATILQIPIDKLCQQIQSNYRQLLTTK